MQAVNQTARHFATDLLVGDYSNQFKRVIVTPAVYLFLAPLKRSLKYRHWADVTFYTHLCRLAEG